MKEHTSEFIFTLANKYQICIDNNDPTEFSDENYFAFCKEYNEICIKRDTNLKNHLLSKPNLFRTFLPWRPYIFDTIFQLQWYYDELIIYDPISFEINYFKTEIIEDDKEKLKYLLTFLKTQETIIKEGFLLFGSYDSFSINNKIIENNKFEDLLSKPEIREECDKLVQVYKMIGEDGEKKSYFQIRGYYRNKETLFPVIQDYEKIKEGQGATITYDLVGSKYIPLSLEEIRKLGIYDKTYDGFKEDYHSEIREILNYIDVSSSIKTPILFNRNLDKYVLNNISSQHNIIKSRANEYYKLVLPFVNGIPSERLMDIRLNMPTVFLDFRNFMFEVIYDFEKNGIEPEVLELKIQQKVNPLIKQLDREMKNALTKVKIIGMGAPIVTGLGALGLWHYGIDITKLQTLIFGGLNLSTELGILANYKIEARNAKNNPVYYLWEAKSHL